MRALRPLLQGMTDQFPWPLGRSKSASRAALPLLLMLAIAQLAIVATALAGKPAAIDARTQVLFALACIAAAALLWSLARTQMDDAAPTAPPIRDERDERAGPPCVVHAPDLVPHVNSADLMAQICHELRTPLNAVIGFSSLMEKEIHGPVGHPRYQEYVGHIVQSGQSLLRSAEATLALTTLLARPAGAQVKVCELSDVVAQGLDIMTSGIGTKTTRLTVSMTPGLKIRTDRYALAHALGHLMMHAVGCRPEWAPTPMLTGHLQESTARLRLVVPPCAGAEREAGTALPFLIAKTMLDPQSAAFELQCHDDGSWIADIVLPSAG